MSATSWIRTVYLYLFALVGLAITVIGATMLVNLALKAWIFTEADSDTYYYNERPPSLVIDRDVELVESLQNCDEGCELTDAQLKQIDAWLADYEWWLENNKNDQTDFQKRRRQQQASTALSMIIVGVPLYLYHWATIKRDRRRGDSKKA
ncbi:MAG: hypothetical protein ACPGO5_02150 [Patescibacteria group bacterium]